MREAAGLTTLLSHLRRKARKKDLADNQTLLAALLLLVAAAGDKRRSWRDMYVLANAIAPLAVRNALPLPSEVEVRHASDLLNMPPDAVSSVDPCILPFLYQFFCSSRRDAAQKHVQSPQKTITAEQTIAFTQLYTPAKITDSLLRDCLPGLSTREPTFSVLDPSCGAGNFLLRCFDLIVPELQAAGWDGTRAASHAISNVLFGCDIDPIALWVTSLGLVSRCLSYGLDDPPPANLELVLQKNEPVLGTLSRKWDEDHILNRKFTAVVGNPPYLGRKLLGRKVKDVLRQQFPEAYHDLCAAFLLRGLELLEPGGRLGYITQSSMLFLPSYTKLRQKLLASYQLINVEEAGKRVFPLQTGEKVSSVLLVIENSKPRANRLTRFSSSTADGSALEVEQSRFKDYPNQAFMYSCPSSLITIYGRSAKLEELADIRQGLATGDNQRFLKWWWQVDSGLLGRRYFSYVKGGGSERWYAPIETVIDWQDDGAEIKRSIAERYTYLKGNVQWVVKNERFYFQEGLTFSLVNTKQLSVRWMPAGCIFDVAGSALFADAEERFWLLAYLNSSFAAACATILNPTINFQVGDLKTLPLVSFTNSAKIRLTALAEECVSLKRSLFCLDETDRHASLSVLPADTFNGVSTWFNRQMAKLKDNEHEIDQIVFDQVCRNFDLDADKQRISELCRRAELLRKPLQLPFCDEDDLARLVIRLRLYEIGEQTVSPAGLASHLSGLLQGTKYDAAGIDDYLATRFECDQSQRLHGVPRLSAKRVADGFALSLSASTTPKLAQQKF